MAKSSKTDKQTESNTWVIAMVVVVIAVIIAVVVAIWHQHRQLISEATQSTAYSRSN